MTMPELRFFDFSEDPAGIMPAVDADHPAAGMDVSQMTDKGYDFFRGTGAFGASLEGSVTGRVWSGIVALTASSQGDIPAHYNNGTPQAQEGAKRQRRQGQYSWAERPSDIGQGCRCDWSRRK